MAAVARLYPPSGAVVSRRPELPDDIVVTVPSRPPPLFSTGGRQLPAPIREVSEEVAELREASIPLLEDLNTYMRCAICNTDFKPIDNFTTWLCRFHPKEFVPLPNKRGRHTCCGRSYDSPGCTSCMHVSNLDNYYLMRADPWTAFVEIKQELVDHDIIFINSEMLANQGRPTISTHHTYVVNEWGAPLDPITSEHMVYQINMVRLLSARK